MRKLALVTILALLTTIATAQTVSPPSSPTSKTATFAAPLTWRADGAGLYKFEDGVDLNKAGIANDGSVATGSDEGTCEPRVSYTAGGTITNVSVNWTFTGKVTMEVTTTGKPGDYKPVTNGVPLDLSKSAAGSSLKWRATLAPNSSLSEVRISYKDISGCVGGFGNPSLSGFTARKIVYIKGSPQVPVYNFQIPVRVGESQRAAGCDVYMDSPSKSDMADIRFTQADGETSLPYYLENVTGAKPNRTASFWVKIPEIPQSAGLPIYIYYGCTEAPDLSNPEKVFDFFDAFDGARLDPAKWKLVLENEESAAAVTGSLLELDMARVTTTNCNFASGIIEYRAKVSASGASTGIILAGSTADNDLIASSSITPNAAHCIMQSGNIIANDPKPISPDAFYDYKIISNGSDINFYRYADGSWEAPQAETKCTITAQPMPIGLSAGKGGTGFYCDWIRIRKATATPPQVDTAKTVSSVEEGVDLPAFFNLTLAPDGSIIPVSKMTEGTYISKLILAPFQARMITASWEKIGTVTEGDCPYFFISTNDGGNYSNSWQNGIAKYVSKREFVMGNKLRWKASFRAQGTGYRVQGSTETTSLKKFALTYQPGIINVVIPGGGELIKPTDQYIVMWNAAGYDPGYNMNLSYSLDGGTSFKPIAVEVPNTGSYIWMVPEAESNKVIVKVADSLDGTIYGISPNCFAISQTATTTAGQETAAATVAAEEAAKAAAEAAKAPETTPVTTKSKEAKRSKTSGGLNLYDILIKSGSAPVTGKRGLKTSAGTFQDGDIIMIKPAGFIWGAAERANFTIAQAYLTDSEVTELTSPQVATKGKDKAGHPITEITKMRKHRIDLTKPGAMGKSIAGGSQLVTGKAMVDKSAE